MNWWLINSIVKGSTQIVKYLSGYKQETSINKKGSLKLDLLFLSQRKNSFGFLLNTKNIIWKTFWRQKRKNTRMRCF